MNLEFVIARVYKQLKQRGREKGGGREGKKCSRMVLISYSELKDKPNHHIQKNQV